MAERSTNNELIAEACPILDGIVAAVTPDVTEQRLGMTNFFAWWFSKCDLTLYLDLRAFTPNRKDPPWTERVQLADLEAATDVLVRWNAKRCVYFSVCPRTSADAAARKREGVACVPGLWIDVDNNSPDIVPRLWGFKKPPDHIIHSGHGYHAYWRFDDPVAPTADLKDKLKVLARVLGGDPACAEFARVMRVPFTWNRKNTPHVQARVAA